MKNHATNPRAVRLIRHGEARIAREAKLEERRRDGRHRLTAVERAERLMTEDELQELIVGPNGIGTILGWEWLHVRPGMRAKGRWWTATTGTLSRWPDLVLVRVRDRRLIFAELKRELEHPTPEQERVLAILGALTEEPHIQMAGDRIWVAPSLGRVEVHVWRPSDLRDPIADSVIGRALR